MMKQLFDRQTKIMKALVKPDERAVEQPDVEQGLMKINSEEELRHLDDKIQNKEAKKVFVSLLLNQNCSLMFFIVNKSFLYRLLNN